MNRRSLFKALAGLFVAKKAVALEAVAAPALSLPVSTGTLSVVGSVTATTIDGRDFTKQFEREYQKMIDAANMSWDANIRENYLKGWIK